MRTCAMLMACLLMLPGCTNWGDPPQYTGTETFSFSGEPFVPQTVVSNLRVPWALAWLPDGTLLVTERPGRLLGFAGSDFRQVMNIDVPGVDAAGEHGLMSVAVSPTFVSDHLIYLSLTGRNEKGVLVNRVARYRLESGQLRDAKVLIDNLPAGDYHDGLPLRFGPDGKLWAATGDAVHGELAQRMDSLAGKILRINPDGSTPADNPFAPSPVWSLGHRNSQGFDWSPVNGMMYEVEHGPTAPVDSTTGGGDELNLITKGGNYGWPWYHHDLNAPGFIAPLRQWTPAIAPSGARFYTGEVFPRWRNTLFFATLRGQALWTAQFDPDQPAKITRLEPLLYRQLGRLRAVAQGPDGCLYITTSNRNRRGQPAGDDDKVIRLAPAK